MSPTRITVTAALVAASLAVPAAAQAAGYTYTTIATGSETRSLGSCPAINLLGQVAFTASGPRPGDVRHRGHGAARQRRGADDDRHGDAVPALAGISGNPSINDVGQVAFDANPDEDDSEVILRGSGRAADRDRPRRRRAALRQLHRRREPQQPRPGRVRAASSTQRRRGPVRGRRRAGQHPLPRLDEPLRGLGRPAVADRGRDDRVHRGDRRRRCAASSARTVSGAITQIASGFFNGRVSLNLLGRVAYSAFDAVYLAGSGRRPGREHRRAVLRLRLRRAVASTTATRSRSSPISTTSSSNGVFTGPERDPRRGRPHRHGDRRHAPSQSVSACREMLNPLGQVAATVTYTDGTPAVIRATPR